VQWEAPDHDGSDEIQGYNIYWDDNTATLIGTSIASTSKTTLTYSKTGLSQGLYYMFAVSAYNSIGESVYSNTVSIIAATVPGVP
jgi:hypothetical protein